MMTLKINNYSKLLLVTLFVTSMPLLIYAGNDSTKVVKGLKIENVPDTIPQRKRPRILGRFDRGIVNHLFVKRKTWISGLTVSYIGYSSEDTQFFSLLKDFDAEAKIFSINPFVGYFIKENVCVGIKFGYQKFLGDLGNFNIDIDDDMSFTLKDMRYDQHMLSTTAFYRSYVGLDRGKRFGLFNETSLSFNTGTARYQRGSEENRKDTNTRIREIHLGLNPGATVFIMENVAAELSFGVVGFKYREEKQTTNGEESGWRRSSGANFKINLLNISIGVVAYL